MRRTPSKTPTKPNRPTALAIGCDDDTLTAWMRSAKAAGLGLRHVDFDGLSLVVGVFQPVAVVVTSELHAREAGRLEETIRESGAAMIVVPADAEAENAGLVAELKAALEAWSAARKASSS